MSETTILEGEVLDASPQPTTALATAAVNPFQTMAMVAMERGAVEQLDKLLDLQLRWDAAQAEKAFTRDMSLFKSEPIDIRKSKAVGYKTKEGDFVGYRHATLADVVDGVVSAMGKHGLSHRWVVKQSDGQITVTCIVTHRDGHHEEATMTASPDKSGKKNQIQEVASTITYLQRYTLQAVTGVAAKDIDDDGAGSESEDVELITEEQAQILTDLIDAYVTNLPAFMSWVRGACYDVKIETVADIQAKDFELVHRQLGSIRRTKIAATQEDAGAAKESGHD